LGRYQRLALRIRSRSAGARPRRKPGDKLPGRLRPTNSPAMRRRPVGSEANGRSDSPANASRPRYRPRPFRRQGRATVGPNAYLLERYPAGTMGNQSEPMESASIPSRQTSSPYSAPTSPPELRPQRDVTKRQNDKSPRAAPVNLPNAAFVGTNGHSTARKLQETQFNASFCHLLGPNDVTILPLESNTPN